MNNFESQFVSFDSILCNERIRSKKQKGLNPCSLNVEFHEFKSFSRHVRVTVFDATGHLLDDGHNINLIKSRVLDKMNVIGGFKICNSTDEIYVNKLSYFNETCHSDLKMIRSITFIVNVVIPLNFHFFAIDDNVIRINDNDYGDDLKNFR